MKTLPDDARLFIEKVKPYCISITLGGSWVTQETDSCSDVDLCLISSDVRNKNSILQVVRGTLGGITIQRLHIDAKVYTMVEFSIAIQGIQNPYWYTFFRDGVLLFGETIKVPLFPHIFSNSIWQAIEQVQEAFGFIEKDILIDVACYQLWTAMLLSFTIDCLIHDEPF
jgi:hypothetical protein